MKIWVGYGSEHSSNLVMIGRFKDHTSTAAALRQIKLLTELVADEQAAGRLTLGEHDARFADPVLDFFSKEKLWGLTPAELEQFAYSVSVKDTGEAIELHTDEIDVSGFLKVLIQHGGRIEVYSAHDYPPAQDK